MARRYVNNAKAPKSPAELGELLADPSQAARLLQRFGGSGDRAAWDEFHRAYMAAAGQADPSIAEQVQVETQRVLAQMLKDDKSGGGEGIRRLDLSPGTASPARNALYAKGAPGAKVDQAKLFDGTGDFFQSVWHGNKSEAAAAKQNRLHAIRASMGSTVPSEGGFLVPETLRSDLLAVSLETSLVRPRATVIPMGTLRVPIPSIDETSHASSVLGGIVAFWTEEGATLSESQPNFGRVVLDAKKLTVYCEVPNELMADGPALGGFLDVALPSAVSFYEDVAFMGGSGVGEPLGFVNCGAVATVAAEGGQAAGTIVWENIVKAYSRMLPSSLSRAVWLANINTFPELATMALSVGTGGGPVLIGFGTGNSGAGSPPMTILGRPVLFTEKLPSVGTTGDICFADLGYYLVGDRQVMAVETSPHFRFNQDKTAIRVIERADGRPWLNSAITPKTGTATLSAFVQIATR